MCLTGKPHAASVSAPDTLQLQEHLVMHVVTMYVLPLAKNGIASPGRCSGA